MVDNIGDNNCYDTMTYLRSLSIGGFMLTSSFKFLLILIRLCAQTNTC